MKITTTTELGHDVVPNVEGAIISSDKDDALYVIVMDRITGETHILQDIVGSVEVIRLNRIDHSIVREAVQKA